MKKGNDSMKGIKRLLIYIVTVVILSSMLTTVSGYEYGDDIENFLYPSIEKTARATYVLNGKINKSDFNDNITKVSETSMWNGYAFLSDFSTEPYPGTQEFDSFFRNILNVVNMNDSKVSIYFDFTNLAHVTNIFLEKYEEYSMEFLFLEELPLSDGETVEFKVPQGKVMSIVGMNIETKALNDLTEFVQDGKLSVTAPKGSGDWKVLFFMLRKVENELLKKTCSVNFLSNDASKKFIEVSYKNFVYNYPEYFPDTIDTAYMANINIANIDGGIAWAEDYNEKFEEKYGFKPTLLYPALVYDIGEDYASSKTALYSLRTELLIEGFLKAMNEFASDSKIRLMGNPYAFDSLVPTEYCGDFIKFFKYIDVPVFDGLSNYAVSKKYIKLVSSASYNYGKNLTGANLFSPYEIIDRNTMYRTILETYSKGINHVYLSSIYNSSENMSNNDLFNKSQLAKYVPGLNTLITRLNTLLQRGETVVDVGVVYPIETLNYAYTPGNNSRENIPYADYIDIGEFLHQDLQLDFMYLHPDYIQKNGIDKYSLIILTGCEVISMETLDVLKEYYDKGGKIIATYTLPTKTAEKGKDNEAKEIIEHIFGTDIYSTSAKGNIYKNTNKNGGQAYFICSYDYGTNDYFKNIDLLELAVNEAIKVRDVAINTNDDSYKSIVTYIHRKTEKEDIYFIANTGSDNFSGSVVLKGKHHPVLLDPHTGEITVPEYKNHKLYGENVTSVKLDIETLSSKIIYCGDKYKNIRMPLLYKGELETFNEAGIEFDNGTISFIFSIGQDDKLELAARLDENDNGYILEIEDGRINLLKKQDDKTDIINSVVVPIHRNNFYQFTMTVNEDGFDVFLSGRKLFEATDSTFKQGRIAFGNIDDSSIEVFDIVLLGGLEKVEVVNHSYTVYLVLFLSLILLRLSAMLHKKKK